ncbi:MAG: HD domain-containing protein [Verrucomicrobiota bacterium]
MSRLSIAQLGQKAGETPLPAEIHAHFSSLTEKNTKSGKPYREVTFADATGAMTLKAWENHRQFSELANLDPGTPLCLSGIFTKNQWGLDGSPWAFESLTEDEADQLLAGDTETLAKQTADYREIESCVANLSDPRLAGLAKLFLKEFGDRFRRTAAARKNHHARRGGLVEHVAQMMRTAKAISVAYPDLNQDLLITGVLFHDCGKLWENSYPESGFNQLYNLSGEMMGHIPLGIELVNKLWRELLETPESTDWKTLTPPSDLVRLHLLHLIASHHGTHEFGSPTLPRTPEAFALHYIDNLDAKYEMLKDAYANANELAPGILERQFPLPSNLVSPLPNYQT